MNSYAGLSKNVMMTTTMVIYPACHSVKTRSVDVEPVRYRCITAHVKASIASGHLAVTFQHGRLVSAAMTTLIMLQRLMLAAC